MEPEEVKPVESDLVRPGLCCPLKKLIPNIKTKLRQKVIPPTFKELRRAREPIYECLARELFEDGFPKTAQFLEQTKLTEISIHANAPEGLKLKRLCDDMTVLTGLLDAYRSVEEISGYGMPSDVVMQLLNIGQAFAVGITDYKWIAEEILLRAVFESQKILDDHGQIRAMVLYHLANLYAGVHQYEAANKRYEEALYLCYKKNWQLSVTESLTDALCAKYCNSLGILSNKCMQKEHYDRNQAKFLCDQTIRVAQMSGDHKVLADAYAVYGHFLLATDHGAEALDMYEKCIEQTRLLGSVSALATSEIYLATCCYALKEYAECRKHAMRANKTAKAHNFKSQMAESYDLLAHVEYAVGSNVLAAEYYNLAVDLFSELGETEKMNRARCFAAISAAELMIDPYVNLALKSNGERLGANKYMDKLLRWELSREPFADNISKDVIVPFDQSEELVFKLPTDNSGGQSLDSIVGGGGGGAEMVDAILADDKEQKNSKSSVFRACFEDELKRRSTQ